MRVDVVSLGLACADVMVKPVTTLPEKGTLGLVPTLELHLGGLAGATATVLSKLGAHVAFLGMVGQDGFGDFIENTLNAAGVDTRFTRRSTQASTPATVVLIDDAGERTFLHHPGTAAYFSDADVDTSVFEEAAWVHWGGPGVTPGLDGEPIGRILKSAGDHGCTTSLDTCYDGEGKWFERIEAALPHTNYVMSNIEEARAYTGCESQEDSAAFFLDHGASGVVVKRGDQGLYASDGAHEINIPAHQVDVVDTTGAGDAACAGFIYALLNDWPFDDAVRLANAVGGLTVQRMGGAEAVSSLEEALALMNSAAAVGGNQT
jgi:sugar/nucleoside kinase (ribokinase family)